MHSLLPTAMHSFYYLLKQNMSTRPWQLFSARHPVSDASRHRRIPKSTVISKIQVFKIKPRSDIRHSPRPHLSPPSALSLRLLWSLHSLAIMTGDWSQARTFCNIPVTVRPHFVLVRPHFVPISCSVSPCLSAVAMIFFWGIFAGMCWIRIFLKYIWCVYMH